MSLLQFDSGAAVRSCKDPKMTVKEAKTLLPMALSTVYKYCESGEVPAVKVGGRLLIDRRKVEKLLDIEPTCSCCHV